MKTDQQMQARRMYLHEGKSQTDIAQKPGIDRNSPSALILGDIASSTGKERQASMMQYLDNQGLSI